MHSETLVILEAGAAWPSWLGEEVTEVVTEAVFGADALTLALDRIRRRGAELASVVGVCGPDSGTGRRLDRDLLLRAVAAAVDFSIPEGRLVVVSDGDYGARQELARLVLELSDALESSASTVSVRFRAQPRSSAPPRAA